METISKFTLPGVLYGVTLAFGLWLSSVGKPYNGLLFNIHKLAALGAVVLAVIQLTKTFKVMDPQAWIVALLALAALCVIALFASGALLSTGQVDYGAMLLLHRIGLAVLTLALAGASYLVWQQG